MFGKMNTTGTPATAARPVSKYSGIKCADTRDPMLGIGAYRIAVVGCVEGYNPGKRRSCYKVTVQIKEVLDPTSASKAGEICTIVNFDTPAGLGELKRFALAASGFWPALGEHVDVDTRRACEAQYDALDVQHGGFEGAILEASAGKVNGAPSLVGRIVDVLVTAGKPVPNPQTGAPTGDFFRNYAWGAVPEEMQAQ